MLAASGRTGQWTCQLRFGWRVYCASAADQRHAMTDTMRTTRQVLGRETIQITGDRDRIDQEQLGKSRVAPFPEGEPYRDGKRISMSAWVLVKTRAVSVTDASGSHD